MKNIYCFFILAMCLFSSITFAEEMSSKATFVGIGIVIQKLDDGKVQIDRLISNAPAEKAGLIIGDLITAVKSYPEDKVADVTELTLEEVVNLIRGPEGVPVEITYLRGSLEENVISIVREKFDVNDK